MIGLSTEVLLKMGGTSPQEQVVYRRLVVYEGGSEQALKLVVEICGRHQGAPSVGFVPQGYTKLKHFVREWEWVVLRHALYCSCVYGSKRRIENLGQELCNSFGAEPRRLSRLLKIRAFRYHARP